MSARIFELADKVVELLVSEGATYLETEHALGCVQQHLAFRGRMEEFEGDGIREATSGSVAKEVVAEIVNNRDLRRELAGALVESKGDFFREISDLVSTRHDVAPSSESGVVVRERK